MILLKLLGVIILFVIILLLGIVFSVALTFFGFFRKLTGKGGQQGQWGRAQQSQNQWYSGGSSSSSSTQSSNGQTQGSNVSGQPKPRNSVIDKNEGEYVEFEEIS